MRNAWLVLVFLALPASAFAQEEPERRMEELKKWYENARREAEQHFKAQMEKLERTFQEKAEHLKREFAERRERPDRPREGHREGPPKVEGGLERMIEELHRAVRRLEGELKELRGEMERMRRGHGEHERARPPEPPRVPEAPRMPKREGEPRFRIYEWHDFGDDFRKMFRDHKFDWESFREHAPREFREWGPDRLHEFFKEHKDWFPKDFQREKWFEELHKWMGKEKKAPPPPPKRKPKKDHDDDDDDDDDRLDY